MVSGDGWTTILMTTELPAGKAVGADSPWGPLLLYAREQDVFAIGDVCPHQGAPLHKGPVDLRSGTPMVTCPAHGSKFDLASGAVRRGPAMHAAAAYETRIDGDGIQVRPKG